MFSVKDNTLICRIVFICKKDSARPSKSDITLNPFVYLYARVCGESTVNGKHYACDKAGCLIIEEEEKTAEKLGCLAEAVHRSSTENFLGSGGRSTVIVEEKGSVLVGYKEAGSNSVNSDTGVCKMYRKPLSEVGNASLSCAVCGDLGKGSE